MLLTPLPVSQQVDFIQSLPSLNGCPPVMNLPLTENPRQWPRSFGDLGDANLKYHVLRYCPRGVGGSGQLF
jgi:hypothetical protein